MIISFFHKSVEMESTDNPNILIVAMAQVRAAHLKLFMAPTRPATNSDSAAPTKPTPEIRLGGIDNSAKAIDV